MVSKEMVCEPIVIENVWVTDVAAAYAELPAWLAVIAHVPKLTNVTALPETVQTPVEFDE